MKIFGNVLGEGYFLNTRYIKDTARHLQCNQYRKEVMPLVRELSFSAACTK